jgi:hypothetical protein
MLESLLANAARVVHPFEDDRWSGHCLAASCPSNRLRDLLEFFRRKVVEVLVDRSRRFDAVLNAVETSEHHRREGEVRVAGGVGATELDALCLRALRSKWDTDRGGTVALAVHEVHRSLVTRDQTLERVGGGVGEGNDSVLKLNIGVKQKGPGKSETPAKKKEETKKKESSKKKDASKKKSE